MPPLTVHDAGDRQAAAVADTLLATARPWTACGISRSQWFKLAASGRTPRPIRLGTRRPVYIIAELSAWLAAGAPDRDEWERRKAAK
jgi:predicted DNA-binding transcriptional regulator AlpA